MRWHNVCSTEKNRSEMANQLFIRRVDRRGNLNAVQYLFKLVENYCRTAYIAENNHLENSKHFQSNWNTEFIILFIVKSLSVLTFGLWMEQEGIASLKIIIARNLKCSVWMIILKRRLSTQRLTLDNVLMIYSSPLAVTASQIVQVEVIYKYLGF